MQLLTDDNDVDRAFSEQLKPYLSLWDAQLNLGDINRLGHSGAVSREKYKGASCFPSMPHNAVCMGIADIDVPPPSNINEAINEFLINNYGYQDITIERSVSRRYALQGQEVAPSSVVSVASVISALDIVLSVYCNQGDKVMMLSPTYGPLRERVLSHQLVPIDVPETVLEKGDNNTDTIDIAKLDASCRVFLLCHPNNPTGTVLNEQTQTDIAKFCMLHNILLVTDEVHSEFGFPDTKLKTTVTPFANKVKGIEEHIVRLNGASKAFNLSAIPAASYAVIHNSRLRERFKREVSFRHIDAAPVAKVALIEAYMQGDEWLNKVTSALAINREYTRALMLTYASDVPFTLGNAGYFLWMNLKHLTNENTYTWARKRGVIGVAGEQFNAPHHLRLNLACHPHQIRRSIFKLFANESYEY